MSTTATRRPSRRFAKIATLLAVPAAVAVSGLVVSQASYSAYSATTVNPTSNWATGTVALSDDDGGPTANTAAFNATKLKPGSTGNRCIVVTSTGTLAGFGSTSTAFSSGLGDWAPTGTATENRSYQITYTVSPNAVNDTQNGTAAIGFTWEAQNS